MDDSKSLTENFDFTWAHPSKAQLAALEIARRQNARNVTDVQATELICLAPYSLWYLQAKRWATTPPPDVPLTWRLACQWIVEIVNSGYDAENNSWWRLHGTKAELTRKLLTLMDFGMMLKQYRRQTADTVSFGFEVFIDLVCGRGWETRFEKTIKVLTRVQETRRKNG